MKDNSLIIYKNREKEVICFQESKSDDLINWINLLQNYILCLNYKDFYEQKSIIGKGNFSIVILAQKKHDNQIYAVKQIIKNSIMQEPNGKEELLNEINVLKTINHNNLLNVKEFYESDKYYHFVSEYYSGGSIENIIYNSNYNQTKQIIKQILSGLDYLHSFGIMHRDLKPDNIMFKQKDSLELAIVDFGLSQIIDQKCYNQKCGTPGYVAPEVINFDTKSQQLYGVQCDIFSIGIIFYKLLTQKKLFQGKTHQEILESNKKCDFAQQLQELSENTTKTAYNLLKSMLEINPNQRICAKQALNSPFFTEPEDAYEIFKIIIIKELFEITQTQFSKVNEQQPYIEQFYTLTHQRKQKKFIKKQKQKIMQEEEENQQNIQEEQPTQNPIIYQANLLQQKELKNRQPFQKQNIKVIKSEDVDRQDLNVLDFQGIKWSVTIGQTRENWLLQRETQFNPHRQHDQPLQKYPKRNQVNKEEYFLYKKFYKGLKPKYNHYQLRHCLQATSYHDFTYFNRGGITHCCTLKESLKDFHFVDGLSPCCFDINTNKNIIALGGLNGGLFLQCLKSLKSTYMHNVTRNYAQEDKGDIINYIKLFQEGNNLYILTCQNDKLISIFDVENIRKQIDYLDAGELVNIAKFKPDNRNIIAMFCDKNEAEIADFRQKQIVQILVGHQDYGLTLDWKQDGVYLATGNQDLTVRVWDIRKSNKSVHVLQANVGNTFEVQYIGNEQFLAFIESINYVHFYDIQSDYQNYQSFDLIGEMVGIDSIEDKVFVAVNASDYSGVVEFERKKNKLIYEDIFF
ncbi:protein kinase domain protein [Ichthyophthirius multifiliis]|uniref:Protein kinase domain protein n=1 Tax=Ichthyophthirius multifiliis TaxID=5932 RepID=G0QUY6_ICHMU|nr:protein kinase domain protein [Ichthyophthirius multifiliis]EGR30991.1 protein kinase domain protein [Ichthyophthirius multifiliis]|eukprot:XP_004034477.1 protein kinase domain protein [Ichthyophthirius multifiliis]